MRYKVIIEMEFDARKSATNRIREEAEQMRKDFPSLMFENQGVYLDDLTSSVQIIKGD